MAKRRYAPVRAPRIPVHQYVVAMEAALLVPETGVSIFPWKEPEVQIPLAVRQIHSSTGPIDRVAGGGTTPGRE